MSEKLISTLLVTLFSILFATMTSARTSLLKISHDGLHLVKDSRVHAVYMKPGASLEEYDRIALLACYVAFARNWQQDFNRETMSVQGRVSDKQMRKIRDGLAREFNRVFTQVLSTEGGHQLVRSGGTGGRLSLPENH